MARRSRSWSVLLLVLLGACGGNPPRTQSAADPPRRPVVVLLVVDQLGAWVAEQRFPTFPRDGGFARLVRESGGMRILEHGHASTDTAPGHAALFTGRLPASHGIGANEVLTPEGESVSILRDDSTFEVAAEGQTAEVGSSLAALRGATLADRLRARRPDARIVALSLKDRGALFAAGRDPDAVLYFDPALEAFVTSTAFDASMPVWARSIASTIPARLSTPWTLLDEAFVRAHSSVADDAPGEGDLAGFGTTFPHDYARCSAPGKAFRVSPASDVALVDLGLAALDAYASETTPLLLAISLSANDYVGHVFGPSSWEAWDEQLRLDAQLARLLAGLDARFGEDGYSVMLSADHGVFEMPEEDVPHAFWCGRPDPYERPCDHALRIDPEAVGRDLERVAVALLGPGPWVLGVSDPYVRLTERARSLDAAQRERLVAALIAQVRATSGYVDALDTHAPEACRGVRHADPAIFCEAIVPELGDLFLVLHPGAFNGSTYVPGYGSGHGSPTFYDRRVPLLVRPARGAPPIADRLGRPGEIVRYDTYFAIADRWLGGDGVP